MKILTIILFLILVPFTTANSAHPNCPESPPAGSGIYECTYESTINIANYKECAIYSGSINCKGIMAMCGVFEDKSVEKYGRWVQQQDKNIYICKPF